MKLEQFFKKNEKFINYLKSIKRSNIQKLKLGLIKFEIKEYNYLGFKIWENLNIKYVNQSEKINNLENSNYLMLFDKNHNKKIIKIFLIIFLIFICLILIQQFFYINNELIIYNYINFFSTNNFSNFKLINATNSSINDLIITFCNYYNIF